MDYSFTPEHEELRQTVRRFLDKESPEARVRVLMETERGYDERTWKRMAEEMGLPGLVVSEDHGGAGLGPVELAIVMEEMGRVLFCAPYLSTAVLAASVLEHAASAEARGRLSAAITAGSSIVAVAATDPAAIAAAREGGSWSLQGTAAPVIDGHVADVLLVAARGPEGVALFEVDGTAARLERTALPALDLTRKLSRLVLRGAPARLVSDADASAGLARALERTTAALAAEQVGGAQRCLELSTEYAKTRLQFGRPIGSYQAIKHKCADMLVEVELARSAAYYAAFRAAAGDGAEASSATHMAKAYASEAYFHAAAETIQIHGGMGFTWEHPAHLYFKRAKSSAVLFGDAVRHRRELATALGL